MATFKFDCTIIVHDVECAQDAINALQTALGDYPGVAISVIYHDKPKRI